MSQRFSDEKIAFYLFLFIVAVGVFLRFFDLSGFTFSNDELSALNRIDYNGLGELWRDGVKINDMHPAGVQTFIYSWTSIFGTSEFWVRLPFILLGIGSIMVFYTIAKKWNGKSGALFGAALLATLSYFILYSRLARPYSFGLFFSLLSIHFFTNILLEKRYQVKQYIGFSLSLAACMYIHYYCFLFVGLVGLSGLFLLNKSNWKLYVLSGLMAVVLYLPHLKIFLYQVSQGGLGGPEGWLSAPENDWFKGYFFYVFNESKLLIFTLFILFAPVTAFNYEKLKWDRKTSISLIWFTIPALFGFVYSIVYNPILQYSVLIFSFPALLLFLGNFVRVIPLKWMNVLVVLLLGISTYGTFKDVSLYSKAQFGVFRPIAEKIISWDATHDQENIEMATVSNGPFYFQYYFDQLEHERALTNYNFDEREQLNALKRQVQHSTKPYFVFAWSTRAMPLEVYSIIQEKYPNVVEDVKYYNSRVTLFGKGEKTDFESVFTTTASMDQPVTYWRLDEENMQADSLNKWFVFDENTEFGPTFETNFKNCSNTNEAIIELSASMLRTDTLVDLELVYTVEKKGQTLEWFSSPLSVFEIEMGKWQKVHLARKINTLVLPEDRLKVYVWNPQKGTALLDDVEVSIYRMDDCVFR